MKVDKQKMKKIFFSIIVPVYNIEDYLKDCVSSILGQTEENFELLLIDDGSSDLSGTICNEFAKIDSRVNVIHQNNRGLSGARNAGILKSRGEYIVFCDGDDKLVQNSLDIIYKKLKHDSFPDILLNRFFVYDMNNKLITESLDIFDKINKKTSIIEQYKYCFLLNDIQPTAWSIVIRKKYLIQKNFFFKEKLLHEDELWTPQVFLNAKTISYNSVPIYYYRKNRVGAITEKNQLKNLENKLIVIDELLNLTNALSCKKLSQIYYARCSHILFGILKNINKISFTKNLCDIKKYMIVFLKNYELKYKIIYLIFKLIGIKNLIKLVKYI